jgi:hypothetical protein
VALKAVGPGLEDTAMSAYFQLVMALSWRAFRIDDVNFEVYRAEPSNA